MQWLIAFRLICLSLVILSFNQPCFAERMKIGISVPLTGPAATYGVDIRNMLQFFNKLNGPPKYDLVIEDDKCDPKEAAIIAQRFIHIEKIKIVTGLPCSGTVMASAPIYEAAKVIVMSAGAAAMSISKAGDYIFRARPSDQGAAELLGQFLVAKHKHIGFLVEETEFPQGLAAAISNQLKPKGASISQENFLSTTFEFSSMLLRLKGRGVEGLVLLAQTEKGLVNLVKAVHDLKLSLPIYSAVFPGSPSFLKAAGSMANGIIFSSLPAREDGFTAEGLNLLTAFEAEYGPINSVDYTFSVSSAAFNALDQAIQSGQDVKEYLYRHKFTGAGGEFSFDAAGDLVGMQYVLRQIKNGQAMPVLNLTSAHSIN